MPRVVHFDIAADNPERAISFYREVFGWSFEEWEGPAPYWLIKTGDEGPGIDGGLSKKMPGAMLVNTIDVPSVEIFMQKITQSGGKILSPMQAIPGVGYLAYFQDTEGNVFGIMENNPEAKLEDVQQY
ncbi:MAG TPA: VOC family protein [Candidatus Altiarchaeales archaeon]|nr:VOC family protein [Candidatus Altiarchaeales archaeon]